MADAAPARQDTRFLLLYALALAGGAMAYVPFLTILMPMRVAEMAGAAKVEWLAYATFAGEIAASVSNIGFGWLSDRSGVRVPWIMAGRAGSCAMLLAFAQVATLAGLIVWLGCGRERSI